MAEDEKEEEQEDMVDVSGDGRAWRGEVDFGRFSSVGQGDVMKQEEVPTRNACPTKQCRPGAEAPVRVVMAVAWQRR